ncbi:hypothetical protein BP6252_03343 [Coleophoma cylindrospora]|uniref:Cnl2/NKP2 family protein n=1 Tax=Coleophoma cylindrospora TaxID=1849047 RepID=A0A3D8S7Z9_9HELO|nr:hypothetical protein BP6252_03343 [Coleophoma cylindrospora]
MAPAEATILSAFLLPPAPLPTIMSLKSFTETFPKSQQSSPLIRLLYRDLQRQRAQLTEAIARNVEAEVRRGNAQRRAVVQERRLAEREKGDDEIEVEQILFGQTSRLPLTKPHSLASVLPELGGAAEDIEDEIRRMEEEADTMLEEMKHTIGNLSDLRYGRLANGQLRDQVLEGLERLETTCDKKQ